MNPPTPRNKAAAEAREASITPRAREVSISIESAEKIAPGYGKELQELIIRNQQLIEQLKNFNSKLLKHVDISEEPTNRNKLKR